MALATLFRHLLTLGVLGAGALLLFVTRPRPNDFLDASAEKSASCLANLSAISRAYAQYARDFDGKIPLAVDPEDRFNSRIWNRPEDEPYRHHVQNAPFLHVVLRPYVGSAPVFRCPADVGWTQSRLNSDGLQNVLPSSFKKFGTSYYSWTKYGFELRTVADFPDPSRRTLLFDAELWHRSGAEERAAELFMDGHVELLSKRQHEKFGPPRVF